MIKPHTLEKCASPHPILHTFSRILWVVSSTLLKVQGSDQAIDLSGLVSRNLQILFCEVLGSQGRNALLDVFVLFPSNSDCMWEVYEKGGDARKTEVTENPHFHFKTDL